MGWFAALALLWGWPALTGRVTLPTDGLLQYHPWRYQVAGAEMGYLPSLRETGTDPLFMYYPQDDLYNRELKSGRIALWNPYIFCGAPIAGAAPSAPFSPQRLLAHRFLDTASARQALVLANGFMAGLFLALFLRALGLRLEACLLGGTAWAWGGYMVAWAEFDMVTEAGAWFSFCLWRAERLARTGSWPCAAGLGLGVGLLALSGHPQFELLFGGVLALYVAVRGRSLGKAALAGVAGLLLGASQWLPTLELLRESARPAFSAASMLAENRLLPEQLLTLLFPEALGSLSSDLYLARISSFIQNAEEFWMFVGWIPLMLALLGAASPRREARFFVAVALAALLICSGSPLYHLLVAVVPVLGSFVPGRGVVLISLSLAILAAFGLDRWTDRAAERWRAVVLGLTLAAWACLALWIAGVQSGAGFVHAWIAPLGTAVGGPNPPNYTGQNWWREYLAARIPEFYDWTNPGFLLTGGVGLALLLLLAMRRRLGPAGVAMLLLTAGELLFYTGRLHRWAPRESVYPELPGLRALAEAAGAGRAAGLITGAKPDSLMPSGIRTVSGYDALYPGRAYRMFEEAMGRPPLVPGLVRPEVWTPGMRRLLDLGSATALYTDPTRLFVPTDLGTPIYDADLRIYGNPGALPRAYTVARWTWVESPADARRIALGPLDPSRSAVVERLADAPAPAPDPGPAAALRPARPVRDEPHAVVVQAEGPGLLVLTDTVYPGWEASVDGQPAPVYAVNGQFRGVFLPPGAHRVDFAYRPASVRVGLGLGAAGALLLMGLACCRGRAGTGSRPDPGPSAGSSGADPGPASS